MKPTLPLAALVALLTPGALAADPLCTALADTALYADSALTEEVRPIFQFDGAQFVPEASEGAALVGLAYDVRMQPLLEERSYTPASDWACEDLAPAASPSETLSYDLTPEACRLELSDTRVSFSGQTITFYESSCDIAGEEAGAGGARLLALTCYGSGEEWPARAVITPLADGALALQIDAYQETYLPCDPT